MQGTPRHSGPLQEKLLALFQRAKLPTSPAIARKILALIDNPYSSSHQFARLIEADPALAARLLKMANSAHYAQRNPVTTIQRAVTVLGLGQLRVVALGFELVGHLDRLANCPFDLCSFWQQAALRACLARQTALRVVPSLAEEAFLVGLLQDCGILTLVQGLGEDYARLYREHRGSSGAFYVAERKQFPYTHVDAIAALSTLWQFPDHIARPLASHHQRVRLGGRSPELVRLCAVSYFVGSVEFEHDDASVSSESLLSYAHDDLRLDEADLDEILGSTHEAYLQVAPMLDDTRDSELDVSDMLVAANRHLHHHFSDVHARLRAVEEERDQVLAEQVTLRNALGQYREQAARDPLTSLMNRRAMLDAADSAIALAAERGEPVAVLFIDVDNFKPINDHFGHRVGDEVLRRVAAVVQDAAAPDGMAGRYGGEEFVLIATGLVEADAAGRAERLLTRLRSLEITGVTLRRPITASVGVVWTSRPAAQPLQTLIARADEAMYAAKRTGKDRCCIVLEGEERTGESGQETDRPEERDRPSAISHER